MLERAGERGEHTTTTTSALRPQCCPRASLFNTFCKRGRRRRRSKEEGRKRRWRTDRYARTAEERARKRRTVYTLLLLLLLPSLSPEYLPQYTPRASLFSIFCQRKVLVLVVGEEESRRRRDTAEGREQRGEKKRALKHTPTSTSIYCECTCIPLPPRYSPRAALPEEAEKRLSLVWLREVPREYSPEGRLQGLCLGRGERKGAGRRREREIEEKIKTVYSPGERRTK
jgi:hypothetical protein